MVRNTGAPKTKKRRKKTSRQPEIKGVLCIMISVIGLISLIFPGQTGIFGQISQVTFSYIAGNADWTIPVLIGIIGFHLVYYKSLPRTNRSWGIILIVLLIIIAQQLDRALQEELITRGEIVPISIEIALERAGGGFVGAFFAAALVFIFGEIGTFIVLAFMALIAIMLLTDTTVKDGLVIGKNMLMKLWNTVTLLNEKIYAAWRARRKQKQFAGEKPHSQAADNVPEIESYNKVLTLEDYRERKAQEQVQPQGTTEEVFETKGDGFIEEDFNGTSSKTEFDYTQSSQTKTQDDAQKSPVHESDGDENLPFDADPGPAKNNEKDGQRNSVITSETNYSENYCLPSFDILKKPDKSGMHSSYREDLTSKANLLENTLASFGVQAKVIKVQEGPTITRYELQPEKGVKVSKIVNLSDDLALSMAASEVRIEAPIPGKAAIGIEVPNQDIAPVYLREVLESEKFTQSKSPLSMAIGKDIAGEPVIADLSKMPHLLIAGATGSGKSVCINALIASILFKAHPDEVKLLLIDPKVVELKSFDGLPHLLAPVVSNPKNASATLKNIVEEMEYRYQLFAEAGVREITRYNAMAEEYPDQMTKLPYIVIIIDELADLMMVAPTEVEDTIFRLAQMSRAAGIHLVLATQRPSVDVITGVIKSNITTRIAFAVSSQADSRTILDTGGAEKLLGQGDMLFTPVGSNKPVRLQGAFISDKEIEALSEMVKNQGTPQYREELLEEKSNNHAAMDQHDELLPSAVKLVLESQQASVSLLQRRLRVGYARAARLMDELESYGVVGAHEGSKPRKILLDEEALNALLEKLNTS